MILRFFSSLLIVFALLTLGGGSALSQAAQETTDAPSSTAAQPENPGQASEPVAVDGGLETLLEVLKDPDQRDALIRQLQSLQNPTTSPATNGETAPTVEEAPVNGEASAETTANAEEAEADPIFTQRFAEWSQVSLQKAGAAFIELLKDVAGISDILNTPNEQKLERIQSNWLNLVFVILATFASLTFLAPIMAKVSKILVPPSQSSRVSARIFSVFFHSLGDFIAVGAAFGIGYLVAVQTSVDGNPIEEAVRFLSAFITFGLAFTAIRFFFLPDTDIPTLVVFSKRTETIIHNWTVGLAALLAFGINFLVPLANMWGSFLVGRSVRTLVLTGALIVALVGIRRMAQAIRTELTERMREEEALHAEDPNIAYTQEIVAASGGLPSKVRFGWHRFWPVFAGLYAIGCYFVAVFNPGFMSDLVLLATLQSAAAVGLIVLGSRLFQHASEFKLSVPSFIDEALPALRSRLNSVVPMIVRIAALIVYVIAFVVIFIAWRLLDLGEVLVAFSEANIVWRALSVVLVAVLLFLVWALMSSWIDQRLRFDLTGRNISARTRTLLSLFKNAFTIAVIVLGGMIVLSEIGINIAPLLAGAGVIGLAIGFGSQKLVQDIITGIFIQLENAINEGDVITVAGITGTVEKLTIRSVGLRDLHGVYHFIPFSSVDSVANFMRKYGYHVAEVGVAYRENVPEVKQAMQDAFVALKESEHKAFILGDLEMHGVTALADSSVNVRARIKTTPGNQWAVGRAYTEIIKELFDERNIEIPFPHTTLTIAKDKAGKAEIFPVESVHEDGAKS